MITELHNILDNILNEKELKYTEPYYKLIIRNKNQYIVNLVDSNDSIVYPVKSDKNTNTLVYYLPIGKYYLTSYYEDDNKEKINTYFEEIEVFSNMINRLRVLTIMRGDRHANI